MKHSRLKQEAAPGFKWPSKEHCGKCGFHLGQLFKLTIMQQLEPSSSSTQSLEFGFLDVSRQKSLLVVGGGTAEATGHRQVHTVAQFDEDSCVERRGQSEDNPPLLVMNVRTLEQLARGLFAGFSRSWTFPVYLSHKIVEDLVDIDLALG